MQPKITLIALHTANTHTYTHKHTLTGRVDQKAKNSTANGTGLTRMQKEEALEAGRVARATRRTGRQHGQQPPVNSSSTQTHTLTHTHTGILHIVHN